MLLVPDAWASFYLVCFFLGLAFVLISALLGAGHDLFHTHLPGLDMLSHSDQGDLHGIGGADAVASDGTAPGEPGSPDHVAHVGDGHVVHADSLDQSVHARDSASPLNLMTLMAFLTWFGAAGYILHIYVGFWPGFSLVVAVVFGLFAGWLVFLFLDKVLLPGTQQTWNPAEHEIVGQLARVTIAIPDGGIGEVLYILDGARHSDGAISADGKAIPRETEVVIVGFEKGIAQVERYPDR